jgi:hypothetical protein
MQTFSNSSNAVTPDDTRIAMRLARRTHVTFQTTKTELNETK